MQLSTEPVMRGRVMALRVGIALLGTPIVGWVADHCGPRWALGVGAPQASLRQSWPFTPWLARDHDLRFDLPRLGLSLRASASGYAQLFEIGDQPWPGRLPSKLLPRLRAGRGHIR